jgi:serine/threonine protein kinase
MSAQVVRFLGKGSYGSVFEVQRLSDGQTYALKVLLVGPAGRSLHCYIKITLQAEFFYLLRRFWA